MRTKNNPVGDYAEWLVSTLMGFELASNSNCGFDALDNAVKRYQIKARYITPDNKSRRLGVIWNLNDANFDQVIAVRFDKDYSVEVALMVPHEVIADYATYRERVNGHIMHLRGKILSDSPVVDITNRLKT